MDKATIIFLVALLLYLAGLGVYACVKKLKAKKQIEKDKKEYEREERKEKDK